MWRQPHIYNGDNHGKSHHTMGEARARLYRDVVGLICRGHMFDCGVVMRAVGERMIVAPPLVMTCAQIDEMAGRIRNALDLTLVDVAARGLI